MIFIILTLSKPCLAQERGQYLPGFRGLKDEDILNFELLVSISQSGDAWKGAPVSSKAELSPHMLRASFFTTLDTTYGIETGMDLERNFQ